MPLGSGIGFAKNAVNLFGEAKNPRMEIGHYKKKDSEQMEKQIEESKKFAITMMMKTIQNQDPFNENSDKGNEMLETANVIAQLDSINVNTHYMKEMRDAILNPGFSATDLQGSEIEYDDSQVVFDGKNHAEFRYKIDYNKNFDGGEVKVVVKIRDSEGNVVHTASGDNEKGENKFHWYGDDSKGNKMAIGVYSIEVSATGKKGNKTFHVDAMTTRTGVVKSVMLEDGQPTKIEVETPEGSTRVIEKKQVAKINKKQAEIIPDVVADFDMIGKNASLDFSKMVVIGGKASIYYDNHYKEHGDVKINVMNERGLKVKQINYKGKLNEGVNSLALEKEIEGVQDGKYTISISLKDTAEDKVMTLGKYYPATIVGINKKMNTVFDTEQREFPANLIDAIAVPFSNKFDSQKAELIGKEITYEDDEIIFNNKEISIDHTVPTPDSEGLLYQSNMRIYDEKNNLVKVVEMTADPIDIANDQAVQGGRNGVQELHSLAHANYNTSFSNLTPQEKKEISAQAMGIMLSNPEAYIKQEYRGTIGKAVNSYKWDGKFDPAKVAVGMDKEAKNGDKFTIRFENIYVDSEGGFFTDMNHDGSGNYVNREDMLVSTGRVSEVYKEGDGSIFAVIEGKDRPVPFNKVISGKQSESTEAENKEEAKQILRIAKALKELDKQEA